MDFRYYQQLWAICFGVVFIYLILGVFFKHTIGVWMAAFWYLAGLGGIIFIAYTYFTRNKKKDKIINAKVIKYGNNR